MDIVTTTDGRRLRGQVSRQAVMRVAVDLASVGGLESLTIGTLATATGMSKGGIVALFGTKQQLQLATVAAARQIFTEHVVAPALAGPRGLTRVHALVTAWLSYSEGRVFAGGCFFSAASAEFASRPGPVRDAIAEIVLEWREFLRGAIDRAVASGELPTDTDAAQLAFEITSLLDGANDTSLMFDSAEPYARARRAIDQLVPSPA